MKIVEVKQTVFSEVKLIIYRRFQDERGFFTETFNKKEFEINSSTSFLKDFEIKQINMAYSKKNVIRGLHFQWTPYMGKLLRVIKGRMVDLFLDIRLGSPNFGKIATYEMDSSVTDETNQLIFIPVGFAHGVAVLTDTFVEYYCDSTWNPKTEASITPLAADIDWSLCNKKLKEEFDKVVSNRFFMSKKDKEGMTVSQWKKDPRSKNFIYST